MTRRLAPQYSRKAILLHVIRAKGRLRELASRRRAIATVADRGDDIGGRAGRVKLRSPITLVSTRSLDRRAATAESASMPIRVGIDLVATSSVEETLQTAHGERYLERVYTDREIADCRTAAGLDPERLAARFAAKEATLKVLPVGNEGLALTSIEVRREPSGRVYVELSGRAAELASEAGVAELATSLTHEGGFAAAVVVAVLRGTGTIEP